MRPERLAPPSRLTFASLAMQAGGIGVVVLAEVELLRPAADELPTPR